MGEIRVSIILAVYNEAAFIARSLGAVLNQDYPADALEILVADGESEDATRDIIRGLPGADRVQVLTNPRRIQAAGLNLALHHAHGEIIIRVDGHTVIAPDYVRQCVSLLKATGAANVGGTMRPAGTTPMGTVIAAACSTRFAAPAAFHMSTTAHYADTVYLGAWPRSILETVGGFDERLSTNEDYELNYRIRQAGGRVYLSPAIRSTYFGRQSLRALAKQYFHYGLGKIQMLARHPLSVRPRQVVAPGFVAVLVLGAALSVFSPAVRVVWLGVVAAYVGLNAAFSLLVSSRIGYRFLWRVCLVYVTLHLAWGVGVWAGIFRGDISRHKGA